MIKKMAFSLPNVLTYGRILAAPLVVACFYGDALFWNWVALIIYIIAAITDFFDGYLARTLNQQSHLGRMLDPIADKLLVAACIVMLVYEGTLGSFTLLAGLIILAREILVSGLREFLAELKVNVPVSWMAKWKTAIQLVAIGFLIAGEAGEQVFAPTLFIGNVLLWLAALLTLYTGYDYVRTSAKHLVE